MLLIYEECVLRQRLLSFVTLAGFNSGDTCQETLCLQRLRRRRGKEIKGDVECAVFLVSVSAPSLIPSLFAFISHKSFTSPTLCFCFSTSNFLDVTSVEWTYHSTNTNLTKYLACSFISGPDWFLCTQVVKLFSHQAESHTHHWFYAIALLCVLSHLV